MRTEITASLRVSKWLGHNKEVAKYVAGLPVSFWQKGDPVQGSLISRKDDGWKLDSTLSKESSLAEHADRILECVDPVLGSVHGIKIRLSFAVYVHGMDRPPLRLTAGAIRKLAALGAEVDIDLYNLP